MAAEAGARVRLLERGPKLGRKLRLTGKGRCNLTNAAALPEFIEAFAPNGRFLHGAFSRFYRGDLLALLQRLGVRTKVERGGRVFPVSDSALEVAASLERWLVQAGVDVRLNSRVKGLVTAGDRLTGVDLFHGRMEAAAAIVATGGLSYPGTGSTGDGYELASSVGHTVVPPRPALAPMLTEEAWAGDLSGLALKNVEARLVRADTGVVLASEFGEMLFTHTGVSGPIILTLSRQLRDARHPVALLLDLKPALSRDDLHARFVREFATARKFGPFVRELLPRSLAGLFPALTGITHDRRLSGITSGERERLIETLKCLRLHVRGLAPIEEAIVTGGGVSLREVDPRTMMSTIVEGLFFAGEVLDLDAVTGGYNLQAAFSTGAVAGRAAARIALDGADGG